MMTTDEVNAYLLAQKESEKNADTETKEGDDKKDLQPSEESQQGADGESPNPTDDGDGTGEETTDTADGTSSDGVADKASVTSEGKSDDDGKGQDDLEKNKARWASSFRKEKEKRKRMKANYERQIASLQKEIDGYKSKMDAEDFDRKSDDGIQTLIDRKSAEKELARIEEEQESLTMQEDLEENERRITTCFPDEEDQKVYRQLVENGGRKFANKLATYDPENVVLSGLDDCDISPIVIRVLMTRPEFLNEILSKRGRHARELAFDSLVNRLRVADRIIREKKTTTKKGEQKDVKDTNKLDSLKATGKQAKAQSSSDGEVVKDSNYWNKYLETHGR